MKKTLKTIAVAMLVAGAAVSSAVAGTKTNLQVLDNITVNLKVYTQGGLNPHGTPDTSLLAPVVTYTTKSLITELGALAGFTPANNMKLVQSSVYSTNVVVWTATNAVPFTNAGATSAVVGSNNALGVGTNLAVDTYGGGTEILPTITSTTTNDYVVYYDGTVTDNLGNYYPQFDVYKITYTGPTTSTTNYFASATNDVVLTNSGVTYTALATLNTNLVVNQDSNAGNFPAPGYDEGGFYPSLAVYETITVTGGPSTTTNVVITQYGPTTATITTNAPENSTYESYLGGVDFANPSICVMTPGSGANSASLVSVDNWVSLNGDGISVVAETGKDLSASGSAGTNVSSETAYSIKDFSINTIYPTNTGTATGMNVYLDPKGFTKSTGKLLNLVTSGTKAEAKEFGVYASVNLSGAASGYIGGTLASLVTNQYTVVSGVTNTNTPFSGNYLGTNYINTNAQEYITGTTNAVCEGTINLTFIGAGAVIAPAQPK
jgi:hypothetical protein